MRFAILHLSDLHRDLANEVDNTTLLDSLERDLDQQAAQVPQILPPSVCIVSGDLVYGVPPNSPDANAELERQYDQALDFLRGLSDRRFGGDRQRVVLLPGNHDVAYHRFAASLEAVALPTAPHEKRELTRELFMPQSRLRWSWPDLSMHRIVDEEQYTQRLSPFARAYREFYDGLRTFSLAAGEQFDIFDYPDLCFCVLALTSCYNNDPLNRAGAFHPTALTQACRSLRTVERTGWLAAAAWHHSLQGGPADVDQLDPSTLQILIQAGVSLGLHGHQHLSECVDESYRIGPSRRKITVVSAGTLCAGPTTLTPGVPRSYNVVEVDTAESRARVHLRQMVNRLFTLPVWGPGYIAATETSFVDVDLCKPLHTRPADLDAQLLLERADQHMGIGEWQQAITLLTRASADERARPLLVRAVDALGDARRTIELIWPPITHAEIVLIGGAILSLMDRAAAERFVALSQVASADDASVRDITRRIHDRLLT
jgi:hypothetical protein